MSDAARDRVDALLRRTTAAWLDDAGSDVVWAGDHEGLHGVRMRQSSRDFTTVWFEVGERTLGYEALLLPDPPHGHAEVYRQCLVRNGRGRWAHIALDPAGDLVVRGRIGLEWVDDDALEGVLGAIHELVDLSFPALVRAGFDKREKTP